MVIKMDLHSVENLGLEAVIMRGTAEILEQDDSGIFLYDTVSETHMIASTDREKVKRWLQKHADRGYPLMAVVGKEIADDVQARFVFRNVLNCHQLAYFGGSFALEPNELMVRKANEAGKTLILANYHLLSEEELTRVIRRGKLLIGELKGETVGFIGEHLEGSMGLLYVLPAYRGRGFATYLEKYQINQMIAAGTLPFGQVVDGNDRSLMLQKKLGFVEGREHVYWLYG